MKQTFNNLRAILTRHKENIPVVVLAEMLAEIDGAEANVCVWKPHGQYGWIITPPHANGSARNRDDLKNRPCCAVCGRKIKVVE